MKKSSIVFLQTVIMLVGIAALALMLLEPQFEGRNVDATFSDIYFRDPFLACAYIASIPFFIALYKAFKVLGYVRQNKIFSQAAANALRTIRYCAIIVAGFIVAGEAYLFTVQRQIEEDIAGGVAMGLVMLFISIAAAAASAMFERVLRNAIDIKSENDSTV